MGIGLALNTIQCELKVHGREEGVDNVDVALMSWLSLQ